MATADLRVFGARPAASRYTKDGGRLRIIRSRPPSSAMEPPSSAHGLADLGGEEPCLLLELADEVLDDASGGGVLGVDVLVHTAQGADNGLNGGDDVGHSLAGEDLPLGGGRDGGRSGNGGRAAVGDVGATATTSPCGATSASSTTPACAGCTPAAPTPSATAWLTRRWAAWKEPWATGGSEAGNQEGNAPPQCSTKSRRSTRIRGTP